MNDIGYLNGFTSYEGLTASRAAPDKWFQDYLAKQTQSPKAFAHDIKLQPASNGGWVLTTSREGEYGQLGRLVAAYTDAASMLAGLAAMLNGDSHD